MFACIPFQFNSSFKSIESGLKVYLGWFGLVWLPLKYQLAIGSWS